MIDILEASLAFFKKAPPPIVTDGHRPLVNFIWINPSQIIDDPDHLKCAINMGAVKRAVKNANWYPGADFNIWVDKKLMGEYTLFCIQSYIDKYGRSGNIQLRNLREIPSYDEEPYFNLPTEKGYATASFNNRSSHGNVYSRADYSRIVVLDHCMQTMPERTRVIYSDIDCRDVKLQKALNRMNKYGIAIHDMEEGISHGYIGLATNNDFVKRCFPGFKSHARQLAQVDSLGFFALDAFLYNLNMPYDEWRHTIGIKGLLPEMFTKPNKILFNRKKEFKAVQQAGLNCTQVS